MTEEMLCLSRQECIFDLMEGDDLYKGGFRMDAKPIAAGAGGVLILARVTGRRGEVAMRFDFRLTRNDVAELARMCGLL